MNGQSRPVPGPSVTSISPISSWLKWLSVGLLGSGFLALNDCGALLRGIQSLGSKAYGPEAFGGIKLNPKNVDDLTAALKLWLSPETRPFAKPLIRAHALIDAFAVVIPLTILLASLLHRTPEVGNREPGLIPSSKKIIRWLEYARWRILDHFQRRYWLWLPGLYALADQVENALTWFVAGANPDDLSIFWLRVLQSASLAKWTFLSAALLILLIAYRQCRCDVAGAISQSREGKAQAPAVALAGVISLVVFFGIVVSFPGSSALTQLPDVIRYHIARPFEDAWLVWALSVASLGLFFVSVVFAGLLSTRPIGQEDGRPNTRPWIGTPLVWALGLSLLLLLIGGTVDSAVLDDDTSFNVVAVVPVGVFLALAFAYLVGRLTGVIAPQDSHLSNAIQVVEAGSQDELHKKYARWVGGLGGAVPVVAGLGLVRATFAPALLERDHLAWRIALGIGITTALFGGLIGQLFVAHSLKRIIQERRDLLDSVQLGNGSLELGVFGVWKFSFLALPVPFLCFWLAWKPHYAPKFGSAAVLTMALAMFALVIGFLKFLSRRYGGWAVTHGLGFGDRSPWILLMLATFTVATLVTKDEGYHDVRVIAPDQTPATHRYPAFGASTSQSESVLSQWLKAQSECEPPEGETIPMVFVAAPGGGIRAAYWTASALEATFGRPGGDNCAARRIFALHGASGGSVGSTIWVASDSSSAREQVANMSVDNALSRVVAGLLLRDLPVVTGIAEWEDRAALMEDGWMSTSTVLDPGDRPLRWSELGDGLSWVPTIVLNGASVADGCRVLIANSEGLPGAPGDNCRSALPTTGGGPVSSSIDPFPGLYDRESRGENACFPPGFGDMSAATAALLSARFPAVSPSGSLLQCFNNSQGDGVSERVTYDVDGGLFENSGLLSLLQVWGAVSPEVTRYNEEGIAPMIEPWFVVLDSGYRSPATAPSTKAPIEFLAPFEAIRKKEVIVTQSSLEQQAIFAMSPSAPVALTAPSSAPPPSTSGAADFMAPRFVVIAPRQRPEIAAPLGWVLSATSRCRLSVQLRELLKEAQDLGAPDGMPLRTLLTRLDRLGIVPFYPECDSNGA